MPLSYEELNVLRSLSEPIDQRRRADFLQEAERRIELAAPQGGAGLAHRIGRAAQREFYDPPADLRHHRVGPRGSRG
jgi:hypothetical protein